jgi:hypothetical protein
MPLELLQPDGREVERMRALAGASARQDAHVLGTQAALPGRHRVGVEG